MDEFSSRRTASGLFFSRKRSGLIDRDQSTPICSRVRCSSRMSSIKDNRLASDKAKTTRRPFQLSTNGKQAIGSSSRTSVGPNPRKSSELRSLEDKTEAGGSVVKSHETRDRRSSQARNNASAESTSIRVSSSSSVPRSRHGKKDVRRYEVGTHDSSIGSRNGANSRKYNFKNLKCDSSNDVKSSSTSTSMSSSSTSKLAVGGNRATSRKRIGERESSLSMRNNDSHHGISVSDSRRLRNFSSNRNDAATKQRSTARARLNEQENQCRLQQTESSSSTILLPQPDISANTNASVSENPSQNTNASGRLKNRSTNTHSNGSHALIEAGFGPSNTRREDTSRHNLDGITEQLFVLETRVFLRGLALHDRHRDLRLDIDNMSYEELLALEERMGTVSTALTEEELAKCLEKSIYEAATDEEASRVGDDGDVKCSICQEEYMVGDEVGRLLCEHRYHVECIQQWLQLRNWCPICKGSAAPSPPSSLLSSSPS